MPSSRLPASGAAGSMPRAGGGFRRGFLVLPSRPGSRAACEHDPSRVAGSAGDRAGPFFLSGCAGWVSGSSMASWGPAAKAEGCLHPDCQRLALPGRCLGPVAASGGAFFLSGAAGHSPCGGRKSDNGCYVMCRRVGPHRARVVRLVLRVGLPIHSKGRTTRLPC